MGLSSKVALFAILSALISVVCLPSVSGQIFHNGGFSERELNEFVKTTMECRHVPGMAMSIVKGKDTWARGFGFADMYHRTPVDNSTVFNIASLTKSFTMVLVGVLLTESWDDWDMKVSEILGPEYEFCTDDRTREMTLRDLLTHRTGLARLDVGIMAGFPKSTTREELCKKLKYIPEQVPFRDSYIYNNYMYMLLGHIAEVIGKDTWENLVTSKVLEPIGMMNTKILREPEDMLQKGVARPYIYRSGLFLNATYEIYPLHPAEPCGAILSSSADMAKYIRFNLDLGQTEHGMPLVRRDLFEEAFRGITATINLNIKTKPTFPVSDTPMGYGYGWAASTYNGYRRNGHAGEVNSYISHIHIFPDMQTGIFTTTNGPGFREAINALATTHYYTADRLLGNEPWVDLSTTCSYPAPWWPDSSATPSMIQSLDIPRSRAYMWSQGHEYDGTYQHGFLPEYKIEYDHHTQELEFTSGNMKGVLIFFGVDDTFFIKINEPWEFNVPDSGGQRIEFKAKFLRDETEEVITGLQVQYGVRVVYDKV